MQIIEELESQLARPSRMYQGYLFDLDGTVYLGKELLPGALALVATLRDRGSKVMFLTNNPTRDPQMYLDKLNGLGIPTAPDELLNTVMTMRSWLLEHAADKKIFVIGEQPLISALEDAGLSLSEDPREIDVVVASYDRTFEYRKLQIAFDAIWFYKRAILIETNPDRFCPFPGGRGEPDCASITAAIEACTRTTCVKSLGKPDPIMLQVTMAGLDAKVEHSMMVGDRLQTDIQMALDTGMVSGLVLTGEATADDVRALTEEHLPSYVMDRVDRLIPASTWDELGWTEDNWADA